METVLDCFDRYVWVQLYASKIAVTVVKILNSHVLAHLRGARREGSKAIDGENPVSGLQEGDPEAQEPEEVNREGGEDRSLKR